MTGNCNSVQHPLTTQNLNVMKSKILQNTWLPYLFFCAISVLQLQVAKGQPELLDPASQVKFVNALPIPSVINARNGGTFNITISQFNQDLGLKDPVSGQPMLTRVWGYNGSYPGRYRFARNDGQMKDTGCKNDYRIH